MNTHTNTTTQFAGLKTTLVAAAVASILAACASAPVRPAGAEQARARLTQLQNDPNLASRAPGAIQAADAAVRVAEEPQTDEQLADYRVYMADRKIDIARADAETRLAEDQRPALRAQSEKARLDARTREVDVARAQGDEQRLAADTARGNADANAANLAAGNSDQQELQRQIDVLQARVTDRGLVVNMGDVLFTGRADAITDGSAGNLDKLVAFLDKYPERTAAIEVYTDSIGTQEYDQALSQRRADSVRSYLIAQGVGSDRLTASGMGDGVQAADDDTTAGPQQNRRVEVIIKDRTVALR